VVERLRLSPRRELAWFAVLLLLASVLRVGWPHLTEFKFSEARLEALALELTREGRVPLVGVPSSAGFDHSPLSVYLYVPAFLFTESPVPATIYGGLVGATAVALSWWLARRWPGGGGWAALVSVLLLATSPWAVAFSRKIWQVVFVPSLALALAGLAISALVRDDGDERPWRLAWVLVAYAVLVQVHPSAISLAPALILWTLLFYRKVRPGPLVAGGLVGAVTAIPFVVHQLRSGWPVFSALNTLPAATWDLTTVRLAWEALTGRGIHALAGEAYPLLEVVPRLGWVFNLIGWLVVGAAVWSVGQIVTGWRADDVDRQQAARVDLILLSWLVVPVVFNLRHSLDLHLHFFALVLPAGYLLVGRGAQHLFQGRDKGWLPWIGIAGLGILATAQVLALVLMGRFVAEHDTQGGFGTPLGDYVEVANLAVAEAGREDLSEILVVTEGDSVVVDDAPAIYDVLLRDKVSYRFVDGQSAAVFPAHGVLVLAAGGVGDATGWYGAWPARALVHGYQLSILDGSWPGSDLEPIAGPRVFENGVELQGYAWSSSSGQGRLWLLWQVLWLSAEDTHFSAQLVDSRGRVVGQEDTEGYPLAYRKKGDRIISRFDITIDSGDPPGLAAVRVGMYSYPDLVHVPVIDGRGNPVGAAVDLDLKGRGP
jgi:hypothetical protein